ncbi:hypothetical protein BDQ17DRAFT_1359796 [Cyathus striatus]|nr:hypothetical protein BDQ17DRAFT_1359796 [Cyathus striatus]
MSRRDRPTNRRAKRDTTSQNKTVPRRMAVMEDLLPNWARRLNGVRRYTPEGPAETATSVLNFNDDSQPTVTSSSDASLQPSPLPAHIDVQTSVSNDGSPPQLAFYALSPMPISPAWTEPMTPSSIDATGSSDSYVSSPTTLQDNVLLPPTTAPATSVWRTPAQTSNPTTSQGHIVYGDFELPGTNPIIQEDVPERLAFLDQSPLSLTWDMSQFEELAHPENVVGSMSPLEYSTHYRSYDNVQPSYTASTIDITWPSQRYALPSAYLNPSYSQTTSPFDDTPEMFSVPSPGSPPHRRRNHATSPPYGRMVSPMNGHIPMPILSMSAGRASPYDSYEEAHWREHDTHHPLHGYRYSPYGRRQGRGNDLSPFQDGTSALGLEFPASAPTDASQQLFLSRANSEFPMISVSTPAFASVPQSFFLPEADSGFLTHTDYWSEFDDLSNPQ